MGKSLQPQNAIAVRQPANDPAVGPAVTPAPSEPATAESLGWQLRAALPPLRLHSLSLYDERANVLWLSEGALGPDEHSVVVEAIDTLSNDTSRPFYEVALEDGRLAIFLAVRSPQGSLVGLAMILADMKSVGDGVVERMITPQIRTVLQKLAVLLRPQARAGQSGRVQILELTPGRDGTSSSGSIDSPGPIDLMPTPVLSPPPETLHPKIPTLSPQAPTLSAQAPTPPEQSPVLSPQAVNDILEFELTPDLPAPKLDSIDLQLPTVGQTPPTATTSNIATLPAPVTSATAAAAPGAGASTDTGTSTGTSIVMAAGTAADISAATAATTSTGLSTGIFSGISTGTSKALSATSTSRVLTLPEGINLILEVQPFSKLRAGGRTRRYEVVARSSQPNRVPPGFDKLALQQLLAWMGSNRAVWGLEPTSFTLNLSISTLEDERFPQFVASNLKANGIAADNIGFEIAEPLCLQRRAQVERFIALCDKLGCFVVIDDFSLDSSLVSLLRSKALRLVKIDPKLTSVALKDKLAQAMVVAITQAVKVLGIHCAAKRVESQASLQWLTAIGCDFAQGSALEKVQPLESLGAQSAATSASVTK